MNASSSDEYRYALGRFTTGVAIVTTADNAGNRCGMTISSFSSVSLEPRLVLWSVGRHAPEYEIFCQSRYYAIHFLSDEQQELSNLFATPGVDKFAAVEAAEMMVGGESSGVPLLPNTLACLQCEAQQNHVAGDHNVLIGQVLNFDVSPDSKAGESPAPLLYFAGGYRKIGE